MVGDFSIHDFESMVIDSNLEDPDKFDLAMLAKKYHWAVNWDLAGSLQRCVQWVKEEKKAIIMVNFPWIQRYVSYSRLVCHSTNGSL